jgi:hypothetical protein
METLTPASPPEHLWIAAAAVDVTSTQAEDIVNGGVLTMKPGMTVQPLDVYCGRCRRPWADAEGKDCLVSP